MLITPAAASRLLQGAACLPGLVTLVLSMPCEATAASIANELVSVELDDARGSLTVTDRVSGRTWGPDPWMGSAGSATEITRRPA